MDQAKGRPRECNAMGDRERGDRRNDATGAFYKEQQGQNEQQMVDAEQNMLDAEQEVGSRRGRM